MEDLEMTSEEKKIINARINELIAVLTPKGTTTDASFFIHGDEEFQTTLFSMHGEPRLLAKSFHRHMDNNPEFKRFIISVIGSYISGRTEDRIMFMNNVGLTSGMFSEDFKVN